MAIVIIGGGRHAIVVRECLGAAAQHVVGILDDRIEPGTTIEDLTVLGAVSELPALRQSLPGLQGIVAIGDNHSRRQVAGRIEELTPGFAWACAVHDRAIVSGTVRIGAGTVVAAGAILSCHVEIGAHVIVNTGSILDHDCLVADCASIGPGVVTGGNVTIGACTHIGLGAVITHGVTIGAHSVIGGNSFVGREIADHTVSYGNPARVIRPRNARDRYL